MSLVSAIHWEKSMQHDNMLHFDKVTGHIDALLWSYTLLHALNLLQFPRQSRTVLPLGMTFLPKS